MSSGAAILFGCIGKTCTRALIFFYNIPWLILFGETLTTVGKESSFLEVCLHITFFYHLSIIGFLISILVMDKYSIRYGSTDEIRKFGSLIISSFGFILEILLLTGFINNKNWNDTSYYTLSLVYLIINAIVMIPILLLEIYYMIDVIRQNKRSRNKFGLFEAEQV